MPILWGSESQQLLIECAGSMLDMSSLWQVDCQLTARSPHHQTWLRNLIKSPRWFIIYRNPLCLGLSLPSVQYRYRRVTLSWCTNVSCVIFSIILRWLPTEVWQWRGSLWYFVSCSCKYFSEVQKFLKFISHGRYQSLCNLIAHLKQLGDIHNLQWNV